MERILMHANDMVAKFTQDPNGAKLKIKEIYKQNLLPEQTEDMSISLQRWMLFRQRPLFDKRFAEIKCFYGDEALTSNSLRSLTDSYWVKDADSNDEWEMIDPRENWDPDLDSIFLMLYDPKNLEAFDIDSPNITIYGSGGLIWGEVNGNIVALNENAQVDVNRYKKALENKITIMAPRKYIIKKGFVFSYRELDVDEDTERIPLDFYYNTYADESKSFEENLATCFASIGIDNWVDFISQLIDFDEICKINNRNMSSVGIIRNIKTLECIGIDKI